MLLAFRTPQTRIYDLAMPLWLAPSTLVDIMLASVIFWELYLPKRERVQMFSACVSATTAKLLRTVAPTATPSGVTVEVLTF